MTATPPVQNALFGDADAPVPAGAPEDQIAPTDGQTGPLAAPIADRATSGPKRSRKGASVQPAAPAPEWQALADQLPPTLRLGTSSWHFPGWAGLVWNAEYAEATLSKQGLAAYAKHPLLGSVSLDRAFYRPLTASQYARYAAQVPPGFRFVVKAPALVCDALVRAEDGRGMAPNPAFLNTDLALQEFIQPALEGLGDKVGALVFQISPLPRALLADVPALIDRIGALLAALPPLAPTAPDGVIALEVRDAAFLAPAHAPLLARALRAARQASGNPVTYCLGLHAKMPPIEDQLPLLRALWPGPLVCRWNLHRRHGAYGYETAKAQYEPFDRLVDPDLETRQHLARVIAGTTGAGQRAYVTINNKAEGSAPLSVLELARAVDAPMHPDRDAGVER
ncbi:DUF72 domain-containing protein [Ottowia testudinis]|uniref:DUF72 domain-containing protein n=1 Tax=Ottowia testudinis TaxID=2816950 RepID=A0A975CIP4_9BURK|nr:DUF72 domain-containing protein [Ottowia testudinis]QTD47168.1 DUF72 domain-containing protein [Ottowia testudinis]